MSEITHDDSVSPDTDHEGPYFEAPDINSVLKSIRSENDEIRFRRLSLSPGILSSAPAVIPGNIDVIHDYTYDIVDPLSSTSVGKYRENSSQDFVDRKFQVEVYLSSSPMWKTDNFYDMAKKEARITVDWTGEKDLKTWTKQDIAASTLTAAHDPTPVPSLPTAFAPSEFERESVLYEINVPAVCLGFINPDDSPYPREAADLNATITILGDTSEVWAEELPGYVSEPYSPSTVHGGTPAPLPEDVGPPSTVRGDTASPPPVPFNMADFASPRSWQAPSVGTLSFRGSEGYSVGTLSDRADRNEGEPADDEDGTGSDFGEPIEPAVTITKASAGANDVSQAGTHLAPPASGDDDGFDLSDLTDTLLSDVDLE